ncbi:serine/threonine-protein kinase [Lentisphaera profundi]|uniref:Serine/threonine-protein kinase n=1 Tax=Lentisphaera profundi TaxID=1658616 RepID=A0ABY7VUK2_9BACT|nr:serine/threonine-protein kinase [Lentisphaera profundi]WDE97576.1 serine/threonine-protein kinase [Lentisphaera profundi]
MSIQTDSEDLSSDMLGQMRSLLDLAKQDHVDDLTTIAPIFCTLSELTEHYGEFELIAKGGMKCIGKVLDLRSNRYIAMARLHEDAPTDLYDSFIREARLTALLEHPNIISIFDMGVDGEVPYFTMELQRGETLRTFMEQSPKPSLTQRLEVFQKICDAIAYAHEQGVVHLDLKPSNIQVGTFGEVVVCDWGLGKVVNGQEVGGEIGPLLLNPDLLNHLTLTGNIKGTPGFMSPEQINKKSEINQFSDIYSLGCVLYFILTDANSIEAESVEQVIDKTVNEGVLSPLRKFPKKNIPASLDAVVLKSTALKVEDRYSSVLELSAEIKKYLEGYSTQAEEADFFRELKLFYRRNKNVCLSALTSLFIIIIFTIYFIDSLQDSRRKAEEARELSEKNRQEAIQEKDRANRILSLYQGEKEWSSDFIDENFHLIKREVYKYTDRLIYDDSRNGFKMALSYLNRLIEEQSSFNWAYNQRAYVHFLMQNFMSAKVDYAMNNRADNNFIELANKYAFQSEPGKPLRTYDLNSLLDDLSGFGKKYEAQMLIMLRYDSYIRSSLSKHSEVVRRFISLYNPQWDSSQMEYFVEDRKLILSGAYLNILALETKHFSLLGKRKENSFMSLIKTLNPRVLDLSSTGIGNLSQLDELQIEELDIRNTPVKNLVLLKNKYVKTLIVGKGQFTDKQLSHLRVGLTVVVQ